jgi:competence protein ComEC
VIGILLLTPALLNKILSPMEKVHGEKKKTYLNRLVCYVMGLIVVSLSATIFLFPIILFYFHRISLVTIPANLMVVPVLGLWIIPLGLLSVLALPIAPQLGGFLLHLSEWGLHGMMTVIRFWSGLPWSSYWVITPNFSEMIMFYALILFIFFFKQRSWARQGIVILAFLILADIGYWALRVHFNKELRVTFLDVGQGNAALIKLV